MASRRPLAALDRRLGLRIERATEQLGAKAQRYFARRGHNVLRQKEQPAQRLGATDSFRANVTFCGLGDGK
jgi:hypothetical protein